MYMKQTVDQAVGHVALPGSQIDIGKLQKFAKYFGALFVLVAATFGGMQYVKHLSSFESTDDAYVTGHVNLISPRVSGVVKAVLVEDNQYVKEGQVLVELDSADYKVAADNVAASLEKAKRQANAALMSVDYSSSKAGAMANDARGAISSAESAIEKAKAALDHVRAGVPMAKSQLQQRESELNLAKLNYDRLKNLCAQGAISQQDLDTAGKDKDVAEAGRMSALEAVHQAESAVLMSAQSVLDAQAQLVRSKASLDHAKAETVQTVVDKHKFDVSKAEISEAQAKLKNANLQLSYTKILAPVSGRIGRKTVEVGQHIQPGQALLAVVPEQFWIVANFKETQLRKMHAGQEVMVKIDALPEGENLRGKVESFSPGSGAQFALLPPDNATGNFTKIVQRVPVKIVLDKNSLSDVAIKKIVPGMSAEVEVNIRG